MPPGEEEGQATHEKQKKHSDGTKVEAQLTPQRAGENRRRRTVLRTANGRNSENYKRMFVSHVSWDCLDFARIGL